MKLSIRPPLAVFIVSLFVCWMPLGEPRLKQYPLGDVLVEIILFSTVLGFLTFWLKNKFAFIMLLFPGFQGVALMFTDWNQTKSLYFVLCLLGAFVVMIQSRFFDSKFLG